MTSTTKTLKINAALRQIETLQAEKVRVQDSWLSRGYAKTSEMVEAIGDQIVALYEEIDAIEAGETTQANRSENQTGKGDEYTPSKAEVEMMKNYGWTIEDLRRQARKARRAC